MLTDVEAIVNAGLTPLVEQTLFDSLLAGTLEPELLDVLRIMSQHKLTKKEAAVGMQLSVKTLELHFRRRQKTRFCKKNRDMLIYYVHSGRANPDKLLTVMGCAA